jgi:hypothetical protein
MKLLLDTHTLLWLSCGSPVALLWLSCGSPVAGKRGCEADTARTKSHRRSCILMRQA